jgi:hypothetical protein
VATLLRMAPILPMSNLAAALAHHGRLGFATPEYADGGYGYATRAGVDLHLDVVADRSLHDRASAYLWVDDTDEAAAEWQAADVEVHEPQDTAWGQHEGAGGDPDENVIRFGSPMGRSTNRGPSPSTK